jgi:hypothetical protein
MFSEYVSPGDVDILQKASYIYLEVFGAKTFDFGANSDLSRNDTLTSDVCVCVVLFSCSA